MLIEILKKNLRRTKDNSATLYHIHGVVIGGAQ